MCINTEVKKRSHRSYERKNRQCPSVHNCQSNTAAQPLTFQELYARGEWELAGIEISNEQKRPLSQI